MSMDCSYYFLTSTAKQIWYGNDTQSENKMFECLSATHKNSFFSKVIYNNGAIAAYKTQEFAENAFLQTWEQFAASGKKGKLNIELKEYTWYFFRAFKFNYLKQVEKELKFIKAEKDFSKENSQQAEAEKKNDNIYSMRTQQVLDKLSADCKQLLNWKHVEGLTHDEIAAQKNITRLSSIKMVSRCNRNFWNMWHSNFNKA